MVPRVGMGKDTGMITNIGPYDVHVAIIERLSYRATPAVRVYLPNFGGDRGAANIAEMTPSFARELSRKLKKYADLADPPKKRVVRKKATVTHLRSTGTS